MEQSMWPFEYLELLEPYKRYDIMLHTRPNRDPCNMKRINNSESTYGGLQFYFREGAPVSAPTNITGSNITQTSMVLTWKPVPVEDVRGVLLGYTLHYKEHGQTHTSAVTNITVDPTLNQQELVDLKSGTMYVVQMSARTSAGAGIKSAARYFETNSQGVSIAIQRIDKFDELEHLNPTSIREEYDTCTLHLPAPAPPLLLQCAGLEGSGRPLASPAGQADPAQRDSSEEEEESSTGGDERTATSDAPRDGWESTPGPLHSDYTTMEMFQRVTPQLFPSCTATGHAGLQLPELGLIGLES
ncbi:Interleukin-31 receptor subunit alpha [Merluccius polli]|uniref:Interleukin-31 receptor subunit alpha n=1 Tax=Merluccius polli TaxID=89951 RepID=A0AA47M3B4_MERPO|nr:Interleukin-31 receptor subunit alpha [Merluccius polli]